MAALPDVRPREDIGLADGLFDFEAVAMISKDTSASSGGGGRVISTSGEGVYNRVETSKTGDCYYYGPGSDRSCIGLCWVLETVVHEGE